MYKIQISEAAAFCLQPKLDLSLSEEDIAKESESKEARALAALKEELETELDWSEADVQKSIEVILGAEPMESSEEAMPPAVKPFTSLECRPFLKQTHPVICAAGN